MVDKEEVVKTMTIDVNEDLKENGIIGKEIETRHKQLKTETQV